MAEWPHMATTPEEAARGIWHGGQGAVSRAEIRWRWPAGGGEGCMRWAEQRVTWRAPAFPFIALYP